MKEIYPKVYLYKRLVQAKLFMDTHYGEAIDLNQIADEACFSKFHFIRLFKSIYGKTPHQYLISVRVEAARRLLATGHSVRDTCFRVGFESRSSFTGLFRQYAGCTPSAYQRTARKRHVQLEEAPLQFIPACFAAQHGWTPAS